MAAVVLDTVNNCLVEWRDGGTAATPGVVRSGHNGPVRRLNSVQVRRIAEDTFEFTRPRSGAVITKRISGKHVVVRDAHGVDVLDRWLSGPLVTAEMLASL